MHKPLFSNSDIRRLIVPLMIEQFLAVTVGMADTIMIASVGETAVSGISLVDTLNILLINVFTALATGGAVVASHYLGDRKREKACQASNQLMVTALLLSVTVTIFSLAFNPLILRTIYGKLDSTVMGYASTYYYLTALSFPFLAAYNGASAICRSMGNSKISMKVSLLMNTINILGNAILIFGFHMKVEGAGISTLIARVTAALIMIWIVRNPKLELHISPDFKLGFDWDMIRRILHIGVPVAIENGLFQGGKLMVAGLIASFGTTAIAANAVGNTIAAFQVIPGSAIGLAMITLVGQTIGAHRYKEARAYAIKLCVLTVIAHSIICIPMILFLKQLIGFYQLSPETAQLAWKISVLHGVFCVLIWSPSFALPNALRAADDVKPVMCITLLSMGLCRIAMSYVLGRYLGYGLFGVWIAMILDWGVRAIAFSIRLGSGSWLKNHFRHLHSNNY